jgi:flagellar hook-associated protein 3 FlgL
VSSRITDAMTARLVLSDIRSVAERMVRTQERMASGKELTRPSDDPFATSRALLYREELASNAQYQRNAQDAASWQSVTDTALGQIGDLVLRARELVVRGANDTLDATGRAAIASELDQITDAMKGIGNTQYAGRYIFAGTATQTAPYTTGGADAYAGNADVMEREVGRGVRMPLNVTGDAVLGDGAAGLIAAMRSAAANLRAGGDIDALRTADLQAITAAQDQLVTTRAAVGARANRLDAAVDRLAQLEEAAGALLSQTEHADMAETLINFSMQQSAYQAALKAGAELIQPSLMDFLR